MLAFLSALTGCVSPALHGGDFTQPTVRTDLERAGILDRHAEFASFFCRRLMDLGAPEDKDCARWLPAARSDHAAQADLRPGGPQRPAVVIIPGIFGECVAKWVGPFSQDYGYLEDQGFQVLVVGAKGRASSAQNARIIHDFFAAPTSAFERAVVIAYSKGVTDFMVAAAQPEARAWSGRVAAFVSVAGVVNGTPLASRGAPLYQMLASIPHPDCAPEDGGGVSSLGYQSALPAARVFARLDKPYRSFSIAAVADGPVNPLLQPFHDLLSRVDRRNDGQVLAEDAVVPGSAFLGTFRADHWSIVLPFEDSGTLAMQPFAMNNHFPRRALITALLDFVNR